MQHPTGAVLLLACVIARPDPVRQIEVNLPAASGRAMIRNAYDPPPDFHPDTGRRAPHGRPSRTGRAAARLGREARLVRRRGAPDRAAGSALGSARGHTDGDRRQLTVASGADAPRRRAPRPPPGALRRRPHQGAPLDAGNIMIALALRGLLGLAGCASTAPAPAAEADTARPPVVRAAQRDPAAEAYYHYTAAQLHAQAGRLKEAIAELKEAIKQDPTTPSLWTQLTLWLSKTDAPQEAIEAGLKAAALAPNDAGVHLTLAELYRGQKRWGEAEAELEKVIALTPRVPEGYLTLARHFVEQRAHDKARGA